MIVPMLHTNGMTAYALASNQSASSFPVIRIEVLTLMLRPLDQLSDHGLNYANVAIERTADNSTSECDPKVRG
jgi:hypothetical protein